ncbi:uncharacterized protein LOC129775403 [Toxorhynchites rutilus septentrionalis]|uniref:uncharacterized protein LOC129775403 n=1 Tax=Toxorhynchites rutilus septentrionalis TaxID=329112 RepID=UPI00247A70B5|nr:uncharacterized protein LOC129775403 [Toxorhynchites rutilus septentrionalis]
MAYINVAEWSSDQVTDWLKGLDNSMYHYVQSFTNNEVGGKQLLNIRPYELEQLGMCSIGHQEIVLEAVEYLKNFNYNLDKENLQFLALHVASASRSLCKQLEYTDQTKLETQILKDITRTNAALKPLIGWLDRAPFRGQLRFDELRKQIMKLGLEMATMAMRDRFSVKPVETIHIVADKMAKIADYIIQDISDPMILQPASLDLVTLKKRESDLGFLVMPSLNGIHRIAEIKFNSPAHNSGKVEEGDEIVQINYQTVVGWEYKKVLVQLQESPPDVLLTLKKRPKHTKIYGQIYIKPYRLPSKKRSLPYRWGENLPSPRVELFALQDFSLPLARVPEKQASSDSESENSDILTPTDVKKSDKDLRLYMPKPRAVLQRRHTLSSFKDLVSVSFWHERQSSKQMSNDPQSLRDKSVSFGFGLEMAPRPTTCLGMVNGAGNGAGANGQAKFSSFGGLKGSLPDIVPADKAGADKADQAQSDSPAGEEGEEGKPGVSKVVRFESNMKFEECHVDTKYTCNVDNTVLETFEPIPYVDEEVPVQSVNQRVKQFESIASKNSANNSNITCVASNADQAKTSDSQSAKVVCAGSSNVGDNNVNNNKVTNNGDPVVRPAVKPIPMQRQISRETNITEAINTVLINREMVKRGRLDKSHSTPAYDDDIPPAIEPRKEHLMKAPPVPPPRPKKTLETNINLVPEKPPPLSPAVVATSATAADLGFISPHQASTTALEHGEENNKSKLANLVDLKNRDNSHAAGGESNIAPLSPPPKPAERIMSPPRRIPASKHFLEGPIETPSELFTPNKTKSLTLKKKNSLLSKRRNVSLKTLCVSDIQGHLYRRTKDRSGLAYWAKYYFVLIETTLYGFKSKDSHKANSMIFLSGFTISLAKEVHSKPFAFKVYHPNKTFYFAAETQEALGQWMEYIKQATLKGNSAAPGSSSADHSVKELFSETDSSEDEFSLMDSQTKLNLLCTPSPQLSSSLGRSSEHHHHSLHMDGSGSTPTSSKQDRYHLNFGSLKKFTKSNPFSGEGNGGSSAGSSESKFFGFFSSHKNVEKSNSSEMPVPTPQFRSYRKVPGSGGGLQIGSNSVSTEVIPHAASSLTMNRNEGMTASNLSLASTSTLQHPPTIHLQPPATPNEDKLQPIIVEPLPEPPSTPIPNETAELLNRAKKNKRISPHNYIHASNPNLVEFDFQTSKAMLQTSSNWDSNPSHGHLHSMITLKDLMLQKQAEEAQDMYNKRVCLGVEKFDDRSLKKNLLKPSEAKPEMIVSNVPESVNKIQKRRLPVTPDYAQSFKLDDEDILYTRSKEGQKLRDFGYELISGDDAFDMKNAAGSSSAGHSGSGSSNNQDIKRQDGTGSIKKKTRTWINSDRRNEESSSSDRSLRDSFKKSKNKAVIAKLDNIKASSEKLFQFKHNNNNDRESLKTKQLDKTSPALNVNLKQSGPLGSLNKNNNNPNTPPFEQQTSVFTTTTTTSSFLASQTLSHAIPGTSATSGGSGQGNFIPGGIKKSNTCNSSSDFKENASKAQSVRKNSAPERGTSYFTKLSFSSSSSKTAKEKKLLGSPGLHRAIFGKNQHQEPTVIDHEVFSPISYTKSTFSAESTIQSNSTLTSTITIGNIQSTATTTSVLTSNVLNRTSPDYPNMEYPPVFEPETYSLSDPSMTLLKRRQNHQQK